MTYLDRAIKDGYAIITGPENKQKIIYVTSDNHTEKLFGSNPLLCPVRDTGTESGNNYQQGFHFMTAGAMSALRNPKAHSNDEVLTAEEALRRLMFASMLMYKLDEAGL